jgi:acetylornithine deacetylase
VHADRLEAAIWLLDRLVAFDTESSKSNLDLIACVEDHLQAQDIPYVKVPNDTGDKAAIFATIGPMIDGGVVLSGHTDVVPVEGQAWTSDPFRMRRDGGRLYGRGTCDMKGFGAIALAMAEEFKAAPLKRPIHILLSYDEETTCLGPVDTIRRFGVDLPRPAAVIVGEPTLMQIADAHKSVSTYLTRVHGVEGHSSQPALGISAIEGACALVTELYDLAEVLQTAGDPSGRFDPPASTVSVGTIHGGTARNILARDCAFHWEFRGLPGVAGDMALRHLEAYAQDRLLPRLNRHGKEACIETISEVAVPGLAPEPGSEAERLAFKLTRSNRTIAVSYATEAGRFQEAGIPTVVCGPGSIAQAHQPDEYLEEAQMEACIAFMRQLIAELI